MIRKIFNNLPLIWLFVIGSNVLAFYPQQVSLAGPVTILGSAYFIFVHRRRLLRLLRCADYLLTLSLLASPVILALLYRVTDLGAGHEPGKSGTFYLSVVLVFLAASVLALPLESRETITNAALGIVVVGGLLNLYELLVQSNVWSQAPGRSAGFYGNPNNSAEALIGYGLVVLLGRTGRLKSLDLMVITLVALGVFGTFSRAGILLSVAFLAIAIVCRTEPRHVLRVAFFAVSGSLLTVAFVWFVLQNVELTGDAAVRILSLIDRGGVGDYQEDRGEIALNALYLAMETPLTGLGFGTTFSMRPGPHNMFVAMFVDYGIFGFLAYSLVLIRMTMIAFKGDSDSSRLLWLLMGWHLAFSFADHNLLTNVWTIPLLGIALARAWQILALRRVRLVAP